MFPLRNKKERFLERINEPEKNWKFSEGDIAERGLWKEYTEAYESAINNTATKKNPWYVIPADQKWFARYLVSEVILSVMEDMDPQYPVLSADKKQNFRNIKKLLKTKRPSADRMDFRLLMQKMKPPVVKSQKVGLCR